MCEVLLNWTDDVKDEQYERSHEALEILESSVDARGSRLTVHKLHQPGPLYQAEEETDSLPKLWHELNEWTGGRLAGWPAPT